MLCLVIYNRMSTIRGKNIVLLVFSMIFYAWGGAQYLALLVGMTFVAWICAREIERHEERTMRLVLFISACVVLIGGLWIF